MNLHILMGRLTRDPEVKQFQSGTIRVRYTIAVDRTYKREGDPDADFFQITAFGRHAEFAEKYFRQGTKILVTYHEQNDVYEKDGRKIYGISRIVDAQEFCESRRAQESRDGSGVQKPAAEPPETDEEGFMNIPEGIDEELPFA